MAQQRLISAMEKNSVSPRTFDLFDYVDAVEQLSELELLNHPRKRKLVEQFASKCLKKLQEEEKAEENKEKVSNFLQRMEMCEMLRQQKIEALRFLEERYDHQCGQLRFYPKLNQRKATQKQRYWKDLDGFEVVSRQQSIQAPNQSFSGDHSILSLAGQRF